ncbi:MAG: Lrp/AsnC family transcriptional regulator [Bryobacterales bacterium]|nr:Lrp/AsnC family transcriptional regulator [Bryobacterales bacterium]MCZ2155107.1 Lrp/AsnC family transcriptional regulator [Bryobacterales bacterium]
MMDELDTKALSLLHQNGRISWAELAQHLHLSAPAAAERVRKLEERGIIRGYGALLDPASFGLGLTAFVAVTLNKCKHRKPFLRAIKKLPEVLECHRVTGEDDYLLKVLVRDTTHLDQLLGESLRAIEGVQRTKTTVVLATLKETTFSHSHRLPAPSE